MKVVGRVICQTEEESITGSRANPIIKLSKLYTRENGSKEKGTVTGHFSTITGAEWRELSATISKKVYAL